MRSKIHWENLIITILFWIFIWQLYDIIINYYQIKQKHRFYISVIGILILSYIIYLDPFYK